MLISSPRSIDSFNLRTQKVENIITTENIIEGISFDGPIRDVFWFEENEVTNFIKSKKLGSGYVDKTVMQKGNLQHILAIVCSFRRDDPQFNVFGFSGLNAVEDLDVDWLNQKLYITDSAHERIIACGLDGTNCVVVVTPVRSSSIFLCPKKG